ncbi:DUF6106 family protein [Butyrivibrio proteoclasticus]|uniref:DUF6106 family protein n=1 Tax=Butyrivibrio proteoclasticus TaxID=43305 RepID=UPI000555F64C|nr:DUF6106 family protein [Butyrivibrio proteoclasticus]
MASDNNYVECLVASKASPVITLLKYITLILAIFSFLAFILIGFIGLIFLVLFGVAYYFLSLNANIEFEYQYCDREITVDKILNKSKRKNVGKYDVAKIEVMAPSRSYHLDEYKNKTLKVLDYSAREKNPQPDPTYTIIYDGKEKLILEPDSDLVAAIKNVAPRKVFTD